MLPGLEQLVIDCAPQVAPTTMMAIIKVESGGNPNAININGARRLARQPQTRQEAISWAQWLIAQGYSIDMGLAQVNSANLRRLNRSARDMFEPCANVAAGGGILADNYVDAAGRYGAGQGALQAALSAYNTGNHRAGFSNGYVAKVAAAALSGSQAAIGQPPLAAPARVTVRRAAVVKMSSREKGNPVAARVYFVKR